MALLGPCDHGVVNLKTNHALLCVLCHFQLGLSFPTAFYLHDCDINGQHVSTCLKMPLFATCPQMLHNMSWIEISLTYSLPGSVRLRRAFHPSSVGVWVVEICRFLFLLSPSSKLHLKHRYRRHFDKKKSSFLSMKKDMVFGCFKTCLLWSFFFFFFFFASKF